MSVSSADFSGKKFSTAYTPPELLFEVGDRSAVPKEVGTKRVRGKESLPYKLVPAAASHDVWSFGVVMFELCSGMKLVPCNAQDNTDPDGFKSIFDFTDEFKHKRLATIPEKQARNLVSQLLAKDPKRRPSMSQVIQHSFFSARLAPGATSSRRSSTSSFLTGWPPTRTTLSCSAKC